MTKQLQDFDTPLDDLGVIYASIDNEGFSEQTLQLIDNYIKIYSMERQTLFNSINRSMRVSAAQVRSCIVCDYARKSLEAGSNVGTGKTSLPNWEIDELQEKLVQQWAEAKNLWSDTAEQDIESEYGSMIAKGAEAKVYYKDGDTSVIKIRTSIYATLGRAFESIVLHNSLFPETP